ncbi:hypothetical protein BDZ94DRAFT_1304553 [Collybia nuda]|uniref:Uncharacterized protein n=1 Tax=Collybia nuda TaxID=64659 RepID=A0A9P5YE15_9AGAR|nr:hypothetical protein BDZ94DRAFT_1304553 [Collybia nuda]
MAIVIANITVAQAATVINAIITFLQYSLGLALVALLLYFLPPLNSANSWSVAARQVHTSLWASIVRSGRTHASTRVNFFSTLSLISALLVAICGIITPLGLKEGPPVRSNYHSVDASFVPDSSPLGLATSPRQEFHYSRLCGGFSPVICPGNTAETMNRTEIPPSVYETFTSTPHGPFDMQFRRYFTSEAGYNFSVSKGQIGLVQSMVLREGIFGAEGVIVDMGDSPGVGLLNHTIPSLKEGATWSQDTLWLEPVTTCVNTNVTVDYILKDEYATDQFNLTDRGGFSNLTTVYPEMSLDGQNIDLHQHAYKGAVLSNFYTMMGFNNMTRNQSYVGKDFPLNRTSTFFRVGDMSTISLKFLSNTTTGGLDVSCKGFGGADNANISNVAVQCGMFASPARRTDGGDERIPSINSTWQQNLHVCASATRASIQTMTFSINSTRELNNLQITRKPSTTPVLWAVEKTDLKINDVDLFWGHVADKCESDPSLSTIRSTGLYVPAGGADIWGVSVSGQPSTIPAIAWEKVYDTSGDLPYSGKDNYALLTKWQSLLAKDPELGHAQIRNMIWTDIVANNLVGSESHSTLAVASLGPSVTYDLKYGIPLLVLFLIWAPSFIGSAIVLLFGMLRISRIRDFLNHTSVGRLAVGHSALVAAERISPPDSEPIHPNEDGWRKTVGETPVSFRPVINLQRSGSDQEVLYNELPKIGSF